MNIREILGLSPVIPVLTINELEHAVPLARALFGGGLKVLQVTLRTPVALACIDAIRKSCPEVTVGVGTLTKPADFAAAGRVGAHFGVSPGLTSELAAASRGARFPLLPGVMTPSEVISARQFGFQAMRLFPANLAGGPRMLQAMGALFPDVVFCPAGGIGLNDAKAYLSLPNVVSVGASWMAPPTLLQALDWAAIETLARQAATLRDT